MIKRICIITSSYPQKKGERSTSKDFAWLLSKRGFEVFVIAPSRSGEETLEDESFHVKFIPWLLRTDLPLSAHNPRNPIHFIKLVSMLFSGIFHTIQFIKKYKIQYCFALWAIPSGFFALLNKFVNKTPYSVWALGSEIWKIDDYPLGKIFLKKILKNASNLFADGIQLCSDVEKISKRKCTFLASNRLFDITLKKISYARFNPEKINYIFLGRYHFNKGVDLLIKAVNELTEAEKAKILFHIFGMKGPEEQNCIELVKKLNLGSTIFVNKGIPGDDVYSYLVKSDFVIIPSRIESIPVVFSNAIQSEKPLIVTDVGDMGKLVEKYNVGFVCKPNFKDIASTIKKSMNSDLKTLSSFNPGRKLLKEYLSFEKSVHLFVNSLNE